MHDIATPMTTKQRRPGNRRATVETALAMTAGRVRDIAALRGLGFSYTEIAGYFNVSPQAISILLQRNRRNLDAIGDSIAMAGLSTRASAALRRLGIDEPEKARGRDVIGELRSARNCGTKTLEEISSWIAGARQSR